MTEWRGSDIAGSTLVALGAANELGHPVTALVAGGNPDAVAKAMAKYEGVKQVLVAKNEAYDHQLAEVVAPLVVEVQKKHGFSHIIAAHTANGKNIMPRVAALLDVAQISDVMEIESDDTFVRPIYAGNAIATVKSKDAVKVLTVRGTAFTAASEGSEVASSEAAPEAATESPSSWVGEELTKSDRPELNAASKVVSGGRGLKNKENFEKIMFPLADAFGAAVGASRAAVDAGYADNSLQVGQTGKIIAPELYVAVGISGAIQHLAGMRDSKTIVSINKDAEAPIYQVADYNLVQDLFTAAPELEEKVKAAK